MTYRNREVRLSRIPEGTPSADCFEIAETEIAAPPAGRLLVRNQWMSLDPAMRVRMGGSGGSIGAVPNYEVGAALDGMAVGEVIESGVEGFDKGDLVVHSLGWRDYALPEVTNPAHRVAKIPVEDADNAQTYLGLMSLVGFTAHVGLFHVAHLQPGETVWVSAAAGAVGSLVAQIAKINGNPVIASVGSADKVAYLRDVIGVDYAFDYHDGAIADHLAEAAPNGIDVYFDNVGGAHLEAALDALNVGGRVALCGMISTYNTASSASGPRNLFQAISKGITIEGFLAVRFNAHMEEYRAQMRTWLAEGRIDYRETVITGLENAPAAIADLMEGRSIGKMIVDLR